jgi:hypothetical protein
MNNIFVVVTPDTEHKVWGVYTDGELAQKARRFLYWTYGTRAHVVWTTPDNQFGQGISNEWDKPLPGEV